MRRRYHREAENRFAQLCAAHGAVCNPSIEDENGWDYIVEFSEPDCNGLPADLVPAQKSALVQIKSTIGKKAKCKLKLSNALRFAKSSLPCFVVLIVFEANSDSVCIYALHFWNDLIGRTFQRAREADRDGRGDLHRLKLTLSFSAKDETGTNVVSWLERQIDSISPDYTTAKRTVVRSVGYDGGGNIVKVTLDPLVSIDQLIDHQLGLGSRISANHVELVNRRFDIDAAMPMFSGKPDHFRMIGNPKGPGVSIRLRSIDGDEIGLDGEIITPAIPNLSESHFKVRIRSWMLDIVWPVSSAPTFKLDFDFQSKRPLQQFTQLGQLIACSEKGQIDCQIWYENKRLFGGQLQLDLPAEKDLMTAAGQVASVLQRVAGSASSSRLAVSLVEIHAAHKELDTFIGLLTAPTIDISFDAGTAAPFDNMLACGFAEIGDWTFMAIVERSVIDDRIEDEKRRLTFAEARWLEHYAQPGGAASHIPALRDDYKRHMSGRNGRTIALPDAISHVKQ